MKNSKSYHNDETLSLDELALQPALSAHLDRQVEDLDFNISSRLSAARHRALAREQTSWGMPRFALPSVIGGSCAAAMVFYVGSQIAIQTVDIPAVALAEVNPPSIIDDLTILSATDDIDFFESVEFLEWIEMNSG